MTLTGGYRRGRNVVSALHVHLVFVTKYRRGVLRPEHLDLLEWQYIEPQRQPT